MKKYGSWRAHKVHKVTSPSASEKYESTIESQKRDTGHTRIENMEGKIGPYLLENSRVPTLNCKGLNLPQTQRQGIIQL
jgi:hypothetical protein